MTRVLFICCHDSFLHHADIRIDVLLRMSAVLRNHFDDSASDDDTVRNFCNVGRLICRVDAEAYGYRNIGYFADCGDHGIEVCLDLASDTGNAQRRYEVDKTFGVCGNFLNALLRRRRNQGNDIDLMAALNIV